MDCCSVGFLVVTDYYTTICTGCGRERQSGITPCLTDVGTNAPLRMSCYLRNKRFETQLDCVIHPLHATFPKSVTLYHMQLKAPFKNMKELVGALKTLTVAKSYTHLHLYSIKYLESYRPPTPVSKRTRYDMLTCFSKVEQRFLSSAKPQGERLGGTAFFSYPWLLLKLLKMFGLQEYTPFVKHISCRKRNAKYESLWKELTLDIMLKEFGVLFKGLRD